MAGNKQPRRKTRVAKQPKQTESLEPTRGTLNEGEPHPSAYNAMKWYNENVSFLDIAMWKESFASCAIEGNRMGEICIETIDRIQNKQTVSDRYLLGLVWMMRDIMEAKNMCSKCGQNIVQEG